MKIFGPSDHREGPTEAVDPVEVSQEFSEGREAVDGTEIVRAFWTLTLWDERSHDPEPCIFKFQ